MLYLIVLRDMSGDKNCATLLLDASDVNNGELEDIIAGSNFLPIPLRGIRIVLDIFLLLGNYWMCS